MDVALVKKPTVVFVTDCLPFASVQVMVMGCPAASVAELNLSPFFHVRAQPLFTVLVPAFQVAYVTEGLLVPNGPSIKPPTSPPHSGPPPSVLPPSTALAPVAAPLSGLVTVGQISVVPAALKCER